MEDGVCNMDSYNYDYCKLLEILDRVEDYYGICSDTLNVGELEALVRGMGENS